MLKIARGIAGFALLFAASACEFRETTAPVHDPSAHTIDVGHWLFGGREGEAIGALFEVLRRRDPEIQFSNHAPEPPTRAEIEASFEFHNPPDSIQIIEGSNVGGWVARQALASLDATSAEEAWPSVFPKAVLDSVGMGGSLYAVPLDIERDNVLFFNKALFDANGVSPPTSIASVLDAASALSQKGVTALSMTGQGWAVASTLFETVLVAEAGPELYSAYLTGKMAPDAPEVQAALGDLARLVDHANPDLATTNWVEAARRICRGEAAMLLMPDFEKGELDAGGCLDPAKIGYVALEPAGTPTFVFIGLGFAVAKEARHPASGMEFARTVGSREGQEAFNLRKLALPARADVDLGQFDFVTVSEAADYRAPGEHLVLGYAGLTPPAFQESVALALAQFVDATSPNYKNVDAVLETLRNQYDLLRK
jgi:glucose/mannose transport system substrate-binding protein